MISSKSFSQGNLDQLFLVAALLSLSIGCTVRFLVDKKIIVAIILKKRLKHSLILTTKISEISTTPDVYRIRVYL
jgi:hypothetical protein